MATVRRSVRIILAVTATAVLLGALGISAGGERAATAQAAAAKVVPPGATALVARLAVLRRAQTPADALPAGTHLPRPGGTILPGLTRLVATLPGEMNVYLVVATPTGGSMPLWSRRLGDQVTIVATGPKASGFDDPYPAVNLDDPFNLGIVGDRTPGTPAQGSAYNIAILPDGVSRVRWRFANLFGGRDAVRTAAVTDNVAIAPVRRPFFSLDSATWYGPDGTVIPTSDTALVHALAARDAIIKARALRAAERHSSRAAPSLLRAFAVFAVTSRRPVHEPGGITVARPRPIDLPLIILEITTHPGRGPGPLDLRQARAIVTRSGQEMWLVPGAHTLCLAVVDQPRSTSPLNGEGGGAAGCGTGLRNTATQSIGLSEGTPRGSFTYGILPRSKSTVTVRVNGHRRVIRPPLGVYVLHRVRGRHGTRTVILSPS